MLQMSQKPLFNSNQAALDHYIKETHKLELKYGRSFEDLWYETEHAMEWTDEQNEIHSLQSKIQTLQYLVKKEQKNIIK